MTTLHTWDGHAVLVDPEDAERLAPLLEAGVSLRVRRCSRSGALHAILFERRPDGVRVTIGLPKVLMSAGPTDEPRCISGDLLDCRRANWSLRRTGAVRVWNSHALGCAAGRDPGPKNFP